MRVAKRGRDDQLRHVAADRLVRAVAEDRLGGVVPAEHAPAWSIVTTASSAASSIARSRDSLARTSSSALAPRDELADLAAEHVHRREQLLVRLAQLAREELHDADDAARAAQREAEGGVQPAAARRVRAREVRVLGRVDDPRRLARLPARGREAPRPARA